MKRTLRNAAAIALGAGLFTCAASLEANAYYLGYGNGDPGNWDFWTEQNGGPKQAAPAPAKPVHHAIVKPHHEPKQKSSEPTHS